MPLSGAINVWVNASPLFSRHYRGRGFCGGPGAAAGFRSSAAADLRDQIDLAIGFERGEVGVLENLAVDRYRHALVDLAAKTRKPAVELQNHPAESVRLHLELGRAAGEPAGGLAREMDARQAATRRSCRSRRAAAAVTSASRAYARRSHR